MARITTPVRTKTTSRADGFYVPRIVARGRAQIGPDNLLAGGAQSVADKLALLKRASEAHRSRANKYCGGISQDAVLGSANT